MTPALTAEQIEAWRKRLKATQHAVDYVWVDRLCDLALASLRAAEPGATLLNRSATAISDYAEEMRFPCEGKDADWQCNDCPIKTGDVCDTKLRHEALIAMSNELRNLAPPTYAAAESVAEEADRTLKSFLAYDKGKADGLERAAQICRERAGEELVTRDGLIRGDALREAAQAILAERGKG